MESRKLLAWIDKLPEVGDPIRRARECIEKRAQEADQLEAAALAVRSLAHAELLELVARLGQLWTPAEIARAQSLALLEEARPSHAH